MKQNYILRKSKNAYSEVTKYLEQLGFKSIELSENGKSIIGKVDICKNSIKNNFMILKYRKRISQGNVIISVGNFETLFLLFLNKLNLIKPNKILWWGFFVHSTKVQTILSVF